jgi:hypothetical protein
MKCYSCGAEFDNLFSFKCPTCTRLDKLDNFIDKKGDSSSPPSNDIYAILLLIFIFLVWWAWPEQSATSIPNTANIKKGNNVIKEQENSTDKKSLTTDKHINEQDSSDIKSLATDNIINEQSSGNYNKTNEINNDQSPQTNTEVEAK